MAPKKKPAKTKPKPKSRRNEPAFLAHIHEQIANLLQADPTSLARKTTSNAKRLFALS